MNRKEHLGYKKYLMNLLPNMCANMTAPLVKIVEIAVLGSFFSPVYIAGLGVAVILLNTFEWLLSWLRASIVLESGQAFQKGDKKLQAKVLGQHLATVIIIWSIIILLKEPIWNFVMRLYQPRLEVCIQGKIFWDTAVWAMPLNWVNYMIMGWLFGRGRIKNAVLLEIGANMLNIILCLLYQDHIKMNDIAEIFFVTQLIILIIGIGVILKEDKQVLRHMWRLSVWYPKGTQKRIKRHRDIVKRTVCTVIMMNIVIATSCRFGTVVLAANFIMMQLKDIISYLFGGIGTTIRGLTARSNIDHNILRLQDIHRMTLEIVMYTSIGIVMFYLVQRTQLINNITKLKLIKQSILTYDGWLIIYPILASWGLSTNGLYLGLEESRFIGISMYTALIIFLISYAIFVPLIGNHGLWLSVIVFYLVRSIMLLGYEGYLYDEARQN